MSGYRDDLDAAQARVRALEDQLAARGERERKPEPQSVPRPGIPNLPEEPRLRVSPHWRTAEDYRVVVEARPGPIWMGVAYFLTVMGSVFCALVLPFLLAQYVDVDLDFVAAISGLCVLLCNLPLSIIARRMGAVPLMCGNEHTRAYQLLIRLRIALAVPLLFAGACGAAAYYGAGAYAAPTMIGYGLGAIGLFVFAGRKKS